MHLWKEKFFEKTMCVQYSDQLQTYLRKQSLFRSSLDILPVNISTNIMVSYALICPQLRNLFQLNIPLHLSHIGGGWQAWYLVKTDQLSGLVVLVKNGISVPESKSTTSLNERVNSTF